MQWRNRLEAAAFVVCVLGVLGMVVLFVSL
jgi:hypothetical protein